MNVSNFKFNKREEMFDLASVSFDIEGKEVFIYFEWDHNDGEKWSFDTTLNHPDAKDSIQARGEITNAVKVSLEYMAEELGLNKNFIESTTKEIVKLAGHLYENAPSCSAHESYYGI